MFRDCGGLLSNITDVAVAEVSGSESYVEVRICQYK